MCTIKLYVNSLKIIQYVLHLGKTRGCGIEITGVSTNTSPAQTIVRDIRHILLY
jgi:hypothetical protein